MTRTLTISADSSAPAPTGAGARRWLRAEVVLPACALGLLGLFASPHLTQASDERVAEVVMLAPRLQDAISLLRARTLGPNQYDPLHDGWSPLIQAGYLRSEPVNPITGSAAISRYPSACAGWLFDPITGRLDACVVDPQTGRTSVAVPSP